jgi:hypothetical protein
MPGSARSLTQLAAAAKFKLGLEYRKMLSKQKGTPAPLAIFRRHSLLDGRAANYVQPPGDGQGHPFLGAAPFNVGDQFVSLALAKALHVQQFYYLTHNCSRREFDIVNSECAALIVISQNSLQPGFFGKFLPRSFVKRIKIPMIFVSLGVQFELDETPNLTDADVESLKAVHDKCVSSQVRGHISAELLAKHGIHNTRALGCPSIVWSQNPKLKVPKPDLRNVGWTLTDMGSRPALNQNQLALMASIQKQSQHFIPIAQGGEIVLQDYINFRDGYSLGQRDDVLIVPKEEGGYDEVAKTNWYGNGADPELVRCCLDRHDPKQLEANVRYYYRDCSPGVVDALIKNSFFSVQVSDYLRHNRHLSLMSGTRVHGNIMALSQGIPSLFGIHDLRIKEMAELFQVPTVDLKDPARQTMTAQPSHEGTRQALGYGGRRHRLSSDLPGAPVPVIGVNDFPAKTIIKRIEGLPPLLHNLPGG